MQSVNGGIVLPRVWQFLLVIGTASELLAPGPCHGARTELVLDLSKGSSPVPDELFGLDLEFTRHDIWEGLSAELLANRMFAIQPNGTLWPFPLRPGGWGHTWPARWIPIGSPHASGAISDRYGGDGSHSIICDGGELCGIYQTQFGDGFDAGVSYGSAITLEEDTEYSLRLALRSPETALVNISLSQSPLKHVVVVLPGEWRMITLNFTAQHNSSNSTLVIVSNSSAYSIGATSLRPINTFHGMRENTVNAMKSLGFSGLLRYPGGCFAPFYQWRNGLLPDLKRAPIATPPK